MATADQLLELIFCWIKEKESFAENLRKLAEELESLRKKCNVAECVGSSFKVLGAASMIGAGVLTVLTGGASLAILASSGAFTGIGSTISQTTQLIEKLCSSTTMEKAKNIEEKSNKIAKEIQQLFQKLKSEKKELNPLADPDELEHHIMAEFLRAIARQCGLNDQIINDSMLNDMLVHTLQEFPLDMISDMDSHRAGGSSSSAGAGRRSEGHFEDSMGIFKAWGGSSSTGVGRRSEGHILDTKSIPRMKQLTSILCAGVLSVVLLSINGVIHKRKTKLSYTVLLRSIGLQPSMMVFGVLVAGCGVYMMTYALPEMIDNWTEMIKGNHVTEASQSMRDTAYEIQETTRTLKERLKKIKNILQEIEQQKLKEIEETEEKESSEDEDPPAVNVGLLNVRSIKNSTEKRLKIKDLITENNLDVFLLTETWLENDTADKSLSETVPPNFWFDQQSREGRGGGVAILFSQALQGFSLIPYLTSKSSPLRSSPSCPYGFKTTFEYVVTAIRHKEWDNDVLFINVYHPTAPNKDQFEKFIDEFKTLLNEASTHNSIIVAGDFNLSRKCRWEFCNRIRRDFHQHVQEQTHKEGGILDLVFSRNVKVSIDNIRDDGISDHFTVYFSIRPV